MNELKNIIERLNKAMTAEELKAVYREGVKRYHPDSDNGEEIENYLAVVEAYERNAEKLNARRKFVNWNKETKQKSTNGKVMIPRHWASVTEFLHADGSEQLEVLKAMVKSVSRRLWNATPKANKKHITDKHKADINGNIDGMRTYCFAKYCYNANHTFNEERIEEVSHNAYIKLAENMYSGKYDDCAVSTILWISCRQALYNTWYAEAKVASWLDRTDDLFNYNAYQTIAPIDWTTEATAVTRVYIEEMDTEKILALAKMGYSNREIADMIGSYPRRIDRLMNEYKATLDADRIRNAMTDRQNAEQNHRKNANPIQIRKALIMSCIRYGMSYKRIGYYIGLTDVKDKKKNTVITVKDQIKAMLTA